jgi:peptidoglycan/xylan/chitin deacetylase (PgdA/CDA1 family)
LRVNFIHIPEAIRYIILPRMRAILTFHSIDDSGSVLSFHEQLFDALLAQLAKKAIPVCDLDFLLSNDVKTGVAITFDDGMKSIHQNALPILQNYDAPAHIFLPTGVIDGGHMLTQDLTTPLPFEMLDWQELEALHLAGVRIECHTHTHPDMRSLTVDQIAEECGKADEVIHSRLGRKPSYFAYPFGYHNKRARDYVRDCYSASVTTELRKLGVSEDTAALPRLDSYYLRSRLSIRLLDSPAMHFYLGLRNSMRNLRGSQCVADQY